MRRVGSVVVQRNCCFISKEIYEAIYTNEEINLMLRIDIVGSNSDDAALLPICTSLKS